MTGDSSFNISSFFTNILSCDQVQLSSAGGKKSIFARQIAAQRVKEGKTPLHCVPEAVHTHETSMDTDQCDAVGDRK